MPRSPVAAVLTIPLLLTLALLGTACAPATQRARLAPGATDQADAIVALARDAMVRDNLRAVILRVTVDGRELVTAVLGESLTDVPATPDMHFRNRAVAISYMSTLLLQLVDQGRVTLDDPLSRWLPDLPHADQVTLRMLANMMAGYSDYVQNERLDVQLYAEPFRQWSPQELIALGLSTPRVFTPGTNRHYSHTNYVIHGQALEKITGQPLAILLRAHILDPLALRNTDSPGTAHLPAPALHAYSSERREVPGIAPSTRFYEKSTYWNPSWTLAQGAIQTTNIYDMTATAQAVGTGSLLSPQSHTAQIAPILRGFGLPLAGCPTCHTRGGRTSMVWAWF